MGLDGALYFPSFSRHSAKGLSNQHGSRDDHRGDHQSNASQPGIQLPLGFLEGVDDYEIAEDDMKNPRKSAEKIKELIGYKEGDLGVRSGGF